jgi:lipid-A-disaccharide synthase
VSPTSTPSAWSESGAPVADTPRLFVVAGEPSGDRLGADLIKRLRVLTKVAPIGVGGPELEGEGLRSLFPMSDLSVMGMADVLARLPLLFWRLRQTVRAILANKPDLVLLIDSQVFAQAIAKRLRAAGYAGKILLYVAPSVWAWKPERAATLRPLMDEILAVLPFEPKVMKDLDGPRTTYVGHPALEQSRYRAVQPERGPLLLLPGSRAGELRRHLPLMREVAAALRDHPAIDGFVLPTVRGQLDRVSAAAAPWNLPVRVTASSEEKRAAFASAVAAVAVSGTITLELALSGVPTVSTYVADKGQLRAAAKYQVRFAALPNILINTELVPEIIGPTRRTDDVVAAIGGLLDNPDSRQRQRAGFERIRALMEQGTPEAPRADAAEIVRDYFRLLTGT